MKHFTDSTGNRVLCHYRKGPGLSGTLTFIDHTRQEIDLRVPIQLTGLTLVIYNRLPRTGPEMETLCKELILLKENEDA